MADQVDPLAKYGDIFGDKPADQVDPLAKYGDIFGDKPVEQKEASPPPGFMTSLRQSALGHLMFGAQKGVYGMGQLAQHVLAGPPEEREKSQQAQERLVEKFTGKKSQFNPPSLDFDKLLADAQAAQEAANPPGTQGMIGGLINPVAEVAGETLPAIFGGGLASKAGPAIAETASAAGSFLKNKIPALGKAQATLEELAGPPIKWLQDKTPRLVESLLKGAGYGAAGSLIEPVVHPEDVADYWNFKVEQAKRGALWGGAFGAGAGALDTLADPKVQNMVGERVKNAMESLGLKATPGQYLGREGLARFDDFLRDTAVVGGPLTAILDHNQRQWNKAFTGAGGRADKRITTDFLDHLKSEEEKLYAPIAQAGDVTLGERSIELVQRLERTQDSLSGFKNQEINKIIGQLKETISGRKFVEKPVLPPPPKGKTTGPNIQMVDIPGRENPLIDQAIGEISPLLPHKKFTSTPPTKSEKTMMIEDIPNPTAKGLHEIRSNMLTLGRKEGLPIELKKSAIDVAETIREELEDQLPASVLRDWKKADDLFKLDILLHEPGVRTKNNLDPWKLMDAQERLRMTFNDPKIEKTIKDIVLTADFQREVSKMRLGPGNALGGAMATGALLNNPLNATYLPFVAGVGWTAAKLYSQSGKYLEKGVGEKAKNILQGPSRNIGKVGILGSYAGEKAAERKMPQDDDE